MSDTRWLSVDEIAARLGVGKETIYAWIEKRDLPAHKVGRFWKFQREDVDNWVKSGILLITKCVKEVFMRDKFSKAEFLILLKNFVQSLSSYVSTSDGQWTIKGFIDIYKNIYTISADTKIVSKILELHIFPKLMQFANSNGFEIELASCQNYYPDLTFIYKKNPKIIFAVDLKTSYRNPNNPDLCNGFTLGSHGEYFRDRSSTKNIQYPYADYSGHFCLGIIYDRVDTDTVLAETEIGQLDNLEQMVSVIKNFQFFAEEKWKIASDKGGSGNTANIGSIKNINDIIAGKGTFAQYGEKIFDDYWMNFGQISITTKGGKTKKLTSLDEYLAYRGMKKI